LSPIKEGEKAPIASGEALVARMGCGVRSVCSHGWYKECL